MSKKRVENRILAIEIGLQRLWLYIKIMGDVLSKDEKVYAEKIAQVCRQIYLCKYNMDHAVSRETRLRLQACECRLERLISCSRPGNVCVCKS